MILAAVFLELIFLELIIIKGDHFWNAGSIVMESEISPPGWVDGFVISDAARLLAKRLTLMASKQGCC